MTTDTQGAGSRSVTELELSNGEKILVETTIASDDIHADFGHPHLPSVKQIAEATESIGKDLFQAIQTVAPDKGSVELGFKVSGEAGIPVLAAGKAEANISVTLEWDKATG